jgi:DNA-binding phage protein
MKTMTRGKIQVAAVARAARKAKAIPTIERIGGPARGWGQMVYAADGSCSWPAGAPVRNTFRFDDPIDEQLRHGIACSRISSSEIARRAGLSAATIDRFMRGADCLSLRQAAMVAAQVGMRLAHQATIEGLAQVWENAGEPAIECPPNRLPRRVAARLRAMAGASR